MAPTISTRDVFSKPALVTFCPSTGRLVAASTNGVIRALELHTTKQPLTGDGIENLTSLAVSANGKLALLTNIDGDVFLADMLRLDEAESGKKLFRSELPLRCAAFTHGDSRCVVGGDDNSLFTITLPLSLGSEAGDEAVVATLTLAESCTHVAYTPLGDKLAVSLSNGDVQIYSLTSETPHLDHTLKGVLLRVAYDSFVDEDAYIPMDPAYACPKVIWSPTGDSFALSTLSREVHVYNRTYAITATHKGGHAAAIADLAWSPSGTLASLDTAAGLAIWHASGMELIPVVAKAPLTNIAWTAQGIAVGCLSGEVLTLEGVDGVGKHTRLVDDRAVEDEEVEEEEETIGEELMGNLPEAPFDLEDDFVIDDDGIGYAEPRKRGPESTSQLPGAKRPSLMETAYALKPYSPGSTPWNGDGRRYLTMNTVGYVWAVKTSSVLDTMEEQIITATFFDRSANTEFYFTDLGLFDLASLTASACVFASSTNRQVHYRLNSSTTAWTRELPYIFTHATIVSLTLTGTMVMVALSNSYVVVYTMHGQLTEMFKLDGPVVAMAADPTANVVLMVHLATSVSLTACDLRYSLYNCDDAKYVQRGLSLPLVVLQPAEPLFRGIFFSEEGDPCLVGQDHLLLVCTKWREPQQATWIPLLDTKTAMAAEVGDATDNKFSSWPLGVFGSTFWCIGLKNTALRSKAVYPSFPLPANTELAFRMPVLIAPNDPEEVFMRSKAMGGMVSASIAASATEAVPEEMEETLKEYAMAYDKAILQLFIGACQESQLAKAVALVRLLRDDKALSAASKIAERFGFLKMVTGITKIRESLMEDL